MAEIPYLCEYDPAWPHWFRQIEHYLRPRLANILRIEHVGSTSVIGMVAKPIIDIDVVTHDGAIADTVAAIEKAGYGHQGDLGIVGREAFKPTSELTRALPPHHLYACEASAFELRKHISFRNYLQAHPSEAQRLSELKRHLAFERQLSRSEYIQAKSPSVEALSTSALAWYAGRHET